MDKAFSTFRFSDYSCNREIEAHIPIIFVLDRFSTYRQPPPGWQSIIRGPTEGSSIAVGRLPNVRGMR
jgi:hypothetical protein